MATNGAGNFDSDTTSDYVGDLVERLVNEVKQALSNPQSIEPDEYYGEVVPCIVEIIATLHQLSGTAAIPPPEVIAGWKSKFLAAREQALSETWNASDPRNEMIRATFDKLQELSRIIHENID